MTFWDKHLNNWWSKPSLKSAGEALTSWQFGFAFICTNYRHEPCGRLVDYSVPCKEASGAIRASSTWSRCGRNLLKPWSMIYITPRCKYLSIQAHSFGSAWAPILQQLVYSQELMKHLAKLLYCTSTIWFLTNIDVLLKFCCLNMRGHFLKIVYWYGGTKTRHGSKYIHRSCPPPLHHKHVLNILSRPYLGSEVKGGKQVFW